MLESVLLPVRRAPKPAANHHLCPSILHATKNCKSMPFTKSAQSNVPVSSKKGPRIPKKKGQKSKRSKQRYQSYQGAIHKVLKAVDPTISISTKGMNIMESLVKHVFESISSESGRLMRSGKHKTLDSRTVQTAVRLALRGELAKHAVSEGMKAVTAFHAAS